MRDNATLWASQRSWHMGRFFAAAVLWLACTHVWAAVVSYDILLDTDNDPATGCNVATARGNFAGVERVLTTNVSVMPTGSTVTGVTVQHCESGALGALRAVSSDSWPVGSFAFPHADPVAVVETFVPLAELGEASTTVRAGIVARTPDGGDALLGANLTIRRAAPPSAVPVPTLSPLVLALLAAGIGLGGAWLARRHQASIMVLGMCVLLSASGMAWAATMLMDGQTTDWSSAQQRLRGDGQNTNLVNLWFDHDAQKAYFRIDTCERVNEVRGQIKQTAAGAPMDYVTTSGKWIIKVDHTTVTVTRNTLCQLSTVEMWGHPHENLNGKHLKDWWGDRRSLILDDGTKITMHADSAHTMVHKMSIYDGQISIEFNNDNNTVLHHSTDPAVAQLREVAEADGETGYVAFEPNNAPGAIGTVFFRNIYTQANPGPAPQCLVMPVDVSCVDEPLSRTGDLYQNPKQVNDLVDDPRLAHT